jgi:hypothetical protein
MTTTATKEKGKLVREGMGGFLNPPTHPEHEWSVQTDLRRRPDNRGSMCLSTAATSEYLDDATRNAAKRALSAWTAPAIDSPEVQAWILQVLGYFQNCYYNSNAGDKGWDAGNLDIDSKVDPLLNADIHAGVRLIRKFYPSYEPTEEEFAAARWGDSVKAKTR